MNPKLMVSLVASLSFLQAVIAQEPMADIIKMCPTIITPEYRSGAASYFYLQPKAVRCLVRAHKACMRMGLSLKIFDAYSPESVQRHAVENDPMVNDPEMCMSHACGHAVDVTLCDADGNELPMPTPFDEFCPEALPDCKTVSPECMRNREMLKSVMMHNGFVCKGAWWHFECVQCDPYDMLNVPLEEVTVSA